MTPKPFVARVSRDCSDKPYFKSKNPNALDTLGRVTQRQIEGGNQPHTATFVWDTLKKGLLTQESANGVVRGYQYDALSRLTQTTVTQSGQVFSIQQHYDSLYGRIKGLEYPNGLTLQYEYNDSGYLTQTKNAASGYVYQEVTAMDWAGRITGANLAESQLERLSLYDTDSSVMLSTQVTKNGSVIHAHDYTLFDAYKNLLQEQNRVTGLEKNYGYDELNRLTSYNFSNQTPNFDQWVYYDYDATGNLLKKTDYSEDKDDAYRYGGDTACNANANAGSNAVCRIEKLDSTTVHFKYDNRGNLLTGDGLTLNYNHMDKPLTVARNSSGLSAANSDFIYGSDGMRAKQVRTANGSTLTTYYVDKLYELDSDGSWRAFIDNVAVLSYTPERKHQILFTLRDRLGSATTLVDHNGSTVSQRYFDPFGRAANAAYRHNSSIMAGESFTDAMLDLADTNRYRRGFTDHEHLNEQQIIHMNGRVYDYNLGRFLSVDPVIQAPTSTQSPNPYSYIMNNPLAGIDPTGYSSCGPDSTKCKTEIKISQTESAIKKSVTATTTSDGNGGATITFSGADKGSRVAARNAVAGKLTSAGFQVSNVGSPGAVSNQPTYGNDPNFQAGFGSIKGDAAALEYTPVGQTLAFTGAVLQGVSQSIEQIANGEGYGDAVWAGVAFTGEKYLERKNKVLRLGGASELLPTEGNVATFRVLQRAGSKGDNITPHHIPSANHMARQGVKKGDGISINMEQPRTGGRHRRTFTYGNQADANMSSRNALAAGVRDARRIYQQDGLYNSNIRGQLQTLINQNKSTYPHIFNKR